MINASHLKLHSLTSKSYRKKHPKAKFRSSQVVEKQRRGMLAYHAALNVKEKKKQLSGLESTRKCPKRLANFIKANKTRSKTEEHRERARLQMKKRWSDPKWRKARSEGMTKQNTVWRKDPEWVKKRSEGHLAWMKGNQTGMFNVNKLEQDYLNIVTEKLGDVIVFASGDKWVTFKDGRHKTPDFVVPGTNKVIEVYGDYWHKGEDPAEIITAYREIGYECLVLWEKQVRNEPALAIASTKELVGSSDLT